MRRITGWLVAAVMLLGAQLAWAAPYASYTFDFYGNAVPAPQAYTVQTIIDGTSLGTTPLREPRDLAVSPGGDITSPIRATTGSCA